MAEARQYVCDKCGNYVVAWSDGNPYYIDEHGEKRYAYHPDHERLARCVGNDSGHLCLACGVEFHVDSRNPTSECPACGSSEFESMFRLDGKQCPNCRSGTFRIDPDYRCIS